MWNSYFQGTAIFLKYLKLYAFVELLEKYFYLFPSEWRKYRKGRTSIEFLAKSIATRWIYESHDILQIFYAFISASSIYSTWNFENGTRQGVENPMGKVTGENGTGITRFISISLSIRSTAYVFPMAKHICCRRRCDGREEHLQWILWKIIVI